MESIYEETKFIMKKYNITANKSLGQNFLVDDDTVYKIVQAAEVSKDDLVIEIGPGLGTLTSRLLENAGKVIAIELDERMLKILQERFKLYNNFKIINEDVLKVDLKNLILKNKDGLNNVKIVANLPYYITTPIIMKLLEEKLEIESITVMVQKEVADRLVAIPGEKMAGAITYCVYYYAEPQAITFVSKEAFVPSPEVDSEVIKLKIRKQPAVLVKNEEKFFKIIKASFMQRRKTLINGLLNGNMVKDKEQAKDMLLSLGISEKERGENLKIEQFAQIADFLDEVL